MKLFMKTLSLVLAVSVIQLCFQQIAWTQEAAEHAPQSWSTPEIEIDKEAPETKKKSSWLWIILGVVAIGGGAAALAGSGGSDSGGGSSDGDSSDTGDYSFQW